MNFLKNGTEIFGKVSNFKRNFEYKFLGPFRVQKLVKSMFFLKNTSKFRLFDHFDPMNVELKISNLFLA